MSSKYLARIKDIYKSYATIKNFQQVAGSCRVVSVDEASLVDIVTTTAILATERGHPGVSVDLNVSYLAPAKIGDTVVVDAFVTKMGKSLGFTRADLYRKQDNKMIATGMHTKAFPSRQST
uniref:Thioesterase domain-containing protein n=1 Tax=Ditylenchus dipsaci TaxID=166011 RepID=A0A915ELS4_9BILA